MKVGRFVTEIVCVVRPIRVAHGRFGVPVSNTVSTALTPSIFQFPSASRAPVYSIFYISNDRDMSRTRVLKTDSKEAFASRSTGCFVFVNKARFLLLKGAMFFCGFSGWYQLRATDEYLGDIPKLLEILTGIKCNVYREASLQDKTEPVRV